MEIRDDVRKLIINKLIENGIVKSNETQKTVTQKVKLSESDEIAISSKGTPYIRSEVFKYLCQQGLRASQENIDIAAEMFKFVEDEDGESYTEVSVAVNEKTNILDNMTNDEVMAYISTQTLIALNDLKNSANQMEYSVITVRDNQYGSTDITALINKINEKAKLGWKVTQIFTNEIGKEASGVGIGGMYVSTNATVDEVVVLFERVKKNYI